MTCYSTNSILRCVIMLWDYKSLFGTQIIFWSYDVCGTQDDDLPPGEWKNPGFNVRFVFTIALIIPHQDGWLLRFLLLCRRGTTAKAEGEIRSLAQKMILHTIRYKSYLIRLAVRERIRKSENQIRAKIRAKRWANAPPVTSEMFSPRCNCHRIGSALLTLWRNGAEPL